MAKQNIVLKNEFVISIPTKINYNPMTIYVALKLFTFILHVNIKISFKIIKCVPELKHPLVFFFHTVFTL